VSRAVVLLSGGMDSAVSLAVARRDGFEAHALSFAYGQRHRLELDAARRVSAALGAASHRVVAIDLAAIGGSALTDPAIEVPRHRAGEAIGAGIPATYVPARNTVFLAVGLGLCEVLGAGAIYLGINAVDYSGYPDCRPAFLEAFQRVAELGTAAGIEGRAPRLVAPLQHLTKAEIVRLGISLGVDFALTLSCYAPGAGGVPCGACDACQLRARGFAEAGMPDPALAG
jgi:7-cyano-7-deazaguanine synthase